MRVSGHAYLIVMAMSAMGESFSGKSTTRGIETYTKRYHRVI